MKAEVILDADYRPAEDEPFMNERQTEYFRRKLNDWKADLMSDSKDTIEGMQEGARNIPDVADRASEETDRALELRTRDRARKLVAKIDSALRRIDDGSYEYQAKQFLTLFEDSNFVGSVNQCSKIESAEYRTNGKISRSYPEVHDGERFALFG